jgi:hypothetical protein
MSRRLLSTARWFIALIVLCALGCGGSGDVSGKITCKGKPVTYGSVTIFAADGIPRYGELGEGGSYKVENVPLGEVKVAVQSPNPFAPIAGEFDKFGKKPAVLQQTLPAKPRVAPGKWFPIPTRYENVQDSGLALTVQCGANSFDIDLKP